MAAGRENLCFVTGVQWSRIEKHASNQRSPSVSYRARTLATFTTDFHFLPLHAADTSVIVRNARLLKIKLILAKRRRPGLIGLLRTAKAAT
jgi:hypothetical protein